MKRIIALFMVSVMLFSVISVLGIALTSNGFSYEIENGEAIVTGYTDTKAAVVIPDTLGGAPVTQIGAFAFADRAETRGTEMTSLTLPKNLKVIGEGAFSVNNAISSVSIPASVETIGARAFHCWMKLTSVLFNGTRLKTIGDSAFRNCHSLVSLSLPKSVEVIDIGAFAYCTSLTMVELPNSLIKLGREAFLGCTSLSAVTIQNDSLVIGSDAFDLTAIDSSDNRLLQISGYQDSTASDYADKEGFRFVTLESPEDPGDPGTVDPPVSTSGSYCVRVSYTITGNNNIKEAYKGFNQENNDSAGISLLYKGKNGTASDYKTVDWDMKTAVTSGSGTNTLTCSVDGFPYLLYGYLDDNAALGSAAYNINKLEVGNTFDSMKTVWTGKINLTSKINPFGVSVDWDNNQKANYFNSDSNNKVSNSSGSWDKPYAKTMSAVYENTLLHLSAQQSTVSNAFTYSAADQYGVTMDSTLCTVQSTASVSANAAYFSTNASAGAGTTVCNKQAHLSGQGHNTQSLTTVFNWQSNGRSNATSTAFTLEDESYTLTFKDETNRLIGTLDVHYGDTMSVALPQKQAQEDCHYTSMGWSPALEPATENATYTATYQQGAHSYELNEGSSTQPSCDESGKNVYYCTVCGYLKEEEIPATGHRMTSKENPGNCQEQGVTTYTCSTCGYSYTEYTPASGHQMTSKKVAATCKQEGYTLHYCTLCTYSYQEDTTPALGHNWNLGVVEKQPDCTEKGIKIVTCKRCGETENREIAALGHDFGEFTLQQKATCTEDGLQSATCARCGNTIPQVIPATDHKWTEWKVEKAAGCGVEGEKERHCEYCNEQQTLPIAALVHSMVLRDVKPEDGKPGCFYYECVNGCGKIQACRMNAAGEKSMGAECASVEEAKQEGSSVIPTTTFNQFKRTESNFNYKDRLASLRIDLDSASDVQPIRFCASMTIPKGARVIDFGYVFTTETLYKKYVRTANKFVIDGNGVDYKSVIDGNYSSFEVDDGTVLTFNVVILCKDDHWAEKLFARPYISFEYAGQTFDVYDTVITRKSVSGIASAVIANPNEPKFIRDYLQEKLGDLIN